MNFSRISYKSMNKSLYLNLYSIFGILSNICKIISNFFAQNLLFAILFLKFWMYCCLGCLQKVEGVYSVQCVLDNLYIWFTNMMSEEAWWHPLLPPPPPLKIINSVLEACLPRCPPSLLICSVKYRGEGAGGGGVVFYTQNPGDIYILQYIIQLVLNIYFSVLKAELGSCHLPYNFHCVGGLWDWSDHRVHVGIEIK